MLIYMSRGDIIIIRRDSNYPYYFCLSNVANIIGIR